MRSLLTLLALLTVLAGSPQAQDFKPFQLYLAAGYQLPSSYWEEGLAIALEPAYRIDDNISVGLRLQAGDFYRVLEGDLDGTPYSWVDYSRCISLTLNGKYYFTDTSFRPYAGFGLGLYDLRGSPFYKGIRGFSNASPTQYRIGGVRKFGFYPRIGFDWWHLNFNVDLNLVGPTDAMVRKSDVRPGERSKVATTTVKNNYVALTLGFFLFGGKRG